MDELRFHGGRIDAAGRAFPDAPVPWLDLSTGLNPRPWPVPPTMAPDLNALPSTTDLAAMEAAAAAAFGIAPACVAALPGVEIGLRLLASLGLPAPLRRVAPAYGSYCDALPTSVAIDADALADRDLAGGTVLLGNPNNPDGRIHGRASLLDLARRIGVEGGWLIVDEAFADVDPATSVLPHLTPDDRVLVFRSFGKFYGLAGVRLGFACGHRHMVDHLRDRIGSWPVSATALAIGTAAYRDHRWAMAARTDLRARAERLDALLTRHGLLPTGDCPLFRLVVNDDAPSMFDRLGRAGILTRPFEDRRDWLRFGLPGDDAAFDRLDRALASG